MKTKRWICCFSHSPPRPETKEGKEGETEKTAEQENNESDKIEKELEKDKVSVNQAKFHQN